MKVLFCVHFLGNSIAVTEFVGIERHFGGGNILKLVSQLPLGVFFFLIFKTFYYNTI